MALKDARITRRRFVQGMIAGSAIAGLDLIHWPGLAAESLAIPTELSGSHFDLAVERVPVNFTGQPSSATAVNGIVPGPLLRWREGDTVTIAVTNRLQEHTSIHWHGIRSPANMDGVPGLSFAGIAPGETFTYRIPVPQRGTYWYHSHSHFQEQTGHYGPLIVEPDGKDSIEYDREYVVLLSDWTDQNPDTIFTNFKMQSDYYNYIQRTAGTFIHDTRKDGLGPTISDRLLWGKMNMAPTDLADISGSAYTYLINGFAPGANWTAIFKPREQVRLRFINGSSMSIFDVRVPGLPMMVVQTDGNDVEPVTIDEFRISVAETYDVIVTPPDASTYTIFVQSIDRTGYARATLASRMGMIAPVPPMDKRQLLTMVDMGMGNMGGDGMSGMSSGSAGGGSEMNAMAGMNMAPSNSEAPAPAAIKPQGTNEQQGAEMPEMPGMNMPAPSKSTTSRPMAMREWNYTTPLPQPGPNVNPPPAPPGMAPKISTPRVTIHAGPEVDNVAMMPTERLNEPGVGLNDNGRRVLTYADLRARYRGVDPRPPTRDIELHLTGNMERFIWGFNGEKFSGAEPIRLKLGERVRFILVNDTMMSHPIHLHGLWSELENQHGEFRPFKHTINVKPGERLSYLVTADTPGHWAYHCHLLYHMEAGMFRTVIVE
jgi:CopA family copper-resistance protein